jgi:hypothetical protein
MDYNALALGIDHITRNMDKRSLACLLEIAQNASLADHPELYVAYFTFLISKQLPDDYTDEERIEFYRRAIETLAIEADSEVTLMVEVCSRCGQPYLAPAGGRPRHHCSPNGYHL